MELNEIKKSNVMCALSAVIFVGASVMFIAMPIPTTIFTWLASIGMLLLVFDVQGLIKKEDE
jgi:hypothetical protein